MAGYFGTKLQSCFSFIRMLYLPHYPRGIFDVSSQQVSLVREGVESERNFKVFAVAQSFNSSFDCFGSHCSNWDTGATAR